MIAIESGISQFNQVAQVGAFNGIISENAESKVKISKLVYNSDSQTQSRKCLKYFKSFKRQRSYDLRNRPVKYHLSDLCLDEKLCQKQLTDLRQNLNVADKSDFTLNNLLK